MAWVGDFAFSMGLGLQSGMCICCPESSETLHDDMREIGPSYFFGPPRFFESLLTSVNLKIDDASSIKRKLFDYFMSIAKEYGEKILENNIWENEKYNNKELNIIENKLSEFCYE